MITVLPCSNKVVPFGLTDPNPQFRITDPRNHSPGRNIYGYTILVKTTGNEEKTRLNRAFILPNNAD